MARKLSIATIEECIGLVGDLPRKDLVDHWVKAHGHPPPKGIKRGLLERDHAYRLQAKVFGRLKPGTTKALLAIAGDQSIKPKSMSASIKAGTRLVREWNGVTHQVDITNEGYDWNAKSYASLSAVARAITGAHWSGPRFFGT